MGADLPGRLLAIDLGETRIGLAISDPEGMIASPYGVFNRRSRREDFAHVGEVVAAEAVTTLVVGLPVLLDGREGRMAAWARDYGTALGEALGLPVIFWDEALTSELAEESLRAQGVPRHKMIGRLDAVAAALLLQSFLEARREPPTGMVNKEDPEGAPD